MLRITVLLGLLIMAAQVVAAEVPGLWVGYYSYGGDNRVPMSMVIQADGSRLIGMMIEPQTSGEELDVGHPSMVYVIVEGKAMVLDKAYFSDLKMLDPMLLKNGASLIQYNLRMSDDGQTLAGRWFLGEQSGRARFKRVTPETVDRMD